MSHKSITILIVGFSVLFLIGALYFASRTLSPREYTAADSPLSSLGNDLSLVPNTPEPESLPPSPISTTPSPSAPSAAVRAATNTERDAYAKRIPSMADAALVPQVFLDVVAHSYGKKDVVIAERPSALVPSSIWKYDPTTRTIATLINEERGAMIARSANGAFLLSSRTLADGSVSLIYEKTTSKERRPLRFATIPPKCFLENRAVLYCGVPLSLPARSVMPDDYLKRKFYTDDRIVRIDLESITVTEIPTGIDTPLDLYEPARIADALVFINRIDGALYAINLPREAE